jgi:hypothetical protein
MLNYLIYLIRHLASGSWNESEIPENIKCNTHLVNFMAEDSRNTNGKFFCEIYDGVFLHYRAGGNWRNEGMTLHKSNSAKLKQLLFDSCGIQIIAEKKPPSR